mmetsp:Transcript_96327/g.210661  ORF Transcript_96327/g.210661 Transcript_96327/m.210661 type:complete len:234 (+) Transcript_96327:145-846(+)
MTMMNPRGWSSQLFLRRKERRRNCCAGLFASVRKAAAKVKAQTLPLYWGIFFDKNEALAKVVEDCSRSFPSYFRKVPDCHVTLLFAGAARSNEAAAKLSSMQLEEFVRLRSACTQLEGRSVEVELLSMAKDADLACFSVQLPEGVPFGNRHPHITVAHSPQVGPVHSNTLLGRLHERARASNESKVVGDRLCTPSLKIVGTVQAFRVSPRRPSRCQTLTRVRDVVSECHAEVE